MPPTTHWGDSTGLRRCAMVDRDEVTTAGRTSSPAGDTNLAPPAPPLSTARKSGHSLDEVAEMGGVSPRFVSRLVDMGLLVPTGGERFSPGDARRAKLVHALEQSGVPIGALSESVRGGVLSLDFFDQPVFDRFSSVSGESFAGLSEKTGIPVELLMVLREVTGSAQPQPGDRVRDDELQIVPFLEKMMTLGVGARSAERLLRVYGDLLRRLAEAEAAWFLNHRMPASSDLLETLDKFPPDPTLPNDRAVFSIYHAQQAAVWTRSIMESVESAMESAGLHSRVERFPAISFVDLAGFTRLTEEEGDGAAAEMAEDLARLVERVAVRHGGRPVKWLGDGVMLYFPEPGPGVLATLEMVDKASVSDLPPAHVGLHAGPILFQDGDYYGKTVNVASRIAGIARAGEVLVSDAVVDASNGVGVGFTDIGPIEMKGVNGPRRLWSAHRMPDAETQLSVAGVS